MLGLPKTSMPRIALFTGISLLAHLTVIALLPREQQQEKKIYQKVSVQVSEVKKEAAADIPPEPAPKPKSQSSSKKEIRPKTEPVLGLSKESFQSNDSPSAFSAPAGNTTDVKDEGKRLSPEEVERLDKDLSSDARLIADSFIKPSYTQEAEDVGLEGSFAIEVYVDETGQVTEAELPRKVGYGMDARLIQAALKARFTPRKDARGRPEAGWTQIKLRLTLE